MQSEGQSHCVEFTVFAKEDRAETSDMPKIQRESIRTRREGLGGSDGAAALLGMNPSTQRSRMQKLGISTSRSVMYGCPDDNSELTQEIDNGAHDVRRAPDMDGTTTSKLLLDL
jgi:hypothetical protein